jgi:DmsE family decaheme c-type cytochrome
MRANHALLVSLTVCGLWAQEPKPAAPAEAAATPDYIGTEACAICHEDLVTQFKRTRHQALDIEVKRGWEGKSCEACHGPGSKHAETADIADIVNPSKLHALKENTACLQCHRNQNARVGRIMSGHAKDQVSCSQCHFIHPKPGQLLFERRKPQVVALCSDCHQSVRASFNRPHGHAVNQGAMSCTDCHNPHNQLGFAARRVSFGNEPSCLGCHQNLRGPFVYEHAPMRLEDCTVCHTPHGSPNPKLLSRNNVQTLCLECHADVGVLTRKPGATGGVPPAFHDLASARFRNCTGCHRKIHGSHVDRSFQR